MLARVARRHSEALGGGALLATALGAYVTGTGPRAAAWLLLWRWPAAVARTAWAVAWLAVCFAAAVAAALGPAWVHWGVTVLAGRGGPNANALYLAAMELFMAAALPPVSSMSYWPVRVALSLGGVRLLTGPLEEFRQSWRRRLDIHEEEQREREREEGSTRSPARVMERARALGGNRRMRQRPTDMDKHKQCSICLDSFNAGETCSMLACGHPYHSKCIENWLARRPACPLCRKPTSVATTISFEEL